VNNTKKTLIQEAAYLLPEDVNDNGDDWHNEATRVINVCIRRLCDGGHVVAAHWLHQQLTKQPEQSEEQ